jgi:hypothetical protein
MKSNIKFTIFIILIFVFLISLSTFAANISVIPTIMEGYTIYIIEG